MNLQIAALVGGRYMPRRAHIDITALYFPERLLQKLKIIKSYPLTIVEAPSGFGKTTAIHGFTQNFVEKDVPIYWHVFLGESFPSSWKNMCQILANVDKACADKLLENGTPDSENMPLVVEALKSLVCTKETYIVLDNYQNSKLASSNRLLEALSWHGGKNLHFIILTQQLSIDELIALNSNLRIYRISPTDLTFTKEDTEAYYKQAGLRISSTQMETVYSRSSGWISVLYLQMLAYIQTGDFETGDLDRLIQTAIWQKVPPVIQESLLTVSLFSSFTLQQLEFMTGTSAFQAMVTLPENPFIRYNRESSCYHIHDILRNYLQLLFEDKPEAEKKQIYMKCGEWFSKNVSFINALRFYYMAGVEDAYDRILQLPLASLDLEDNTEGVDIFPILFDITENTPREVKLRHPKGMISIAFALFLLGEHERLPEIVKEIVALLDACSLPEEEKKVLRGETELLCSFFEYNNIAKMSERHRRSLELIEGPTGFVTNRSIWTFGSPSILFLFHRESGTLAEELRQMEACIPCYLELARGQGRGADTIMHAEVAFYAGELEEAEKYCQQALFIAESEYQDCIYECGLFLLGRISMMRGDTAKQQDALNTLRDHAMRNRRLISRQTLNLCEGYVYAMSGDIKRIPDWLVRGEISKKRLNFAIIPFAHIIYERTLLEQKEYTKLLRAGEYSLDIAGTFPYLLSQIYTKIHLAQAYAGLGKNEKAVELLAEALRDALPDRLYVCFAENYTGIKPLLPMAAAKIVSETARLGNAATKIAFKDGLAQIERLSGPFLQSVQQMNPPHSILSEREQDVFDLITKGYTNKQIAGSLLVSIATVKTLVSRILEKTVSTSRTQLAGKGQDFLKK